ncbi:MAG: hypothetical protein DMG01_03090 [Acidobacteria bacterium]|nr:MAG: hypothetical protein DMG01_03090 [Acidobacteriota bacterium]
MRTTAPAGGVSICGAVTDAVASLWLVEPPDDGCAGLLLVEQATTQDRTAAQPMGPSLPIMSVRVFIYGFFRFLQKIIGSFPA